jgi:O-antigen ligase
MTGFASHWMTFGGEQMILLLLAASFLFFAPRSRWKLPAAGAFVLLLASVALGMTRCILMLGMPAGLAYLVWRWKPAMLLAAPLLVALGVMVAPDAIRERMASAFHPHGTVDSNEHRAVCRAVGWQMVKAHPWFGLGPEQVGRQFNRYIPASVPRPLPVGWYGHLHNIYLQYAAERGIPALLCLLWLLATVVRDFRRHAKAENRVVLHAGIAIVLAILAEGLFEYNLGDSEVLTLVVSVLACGYVAIRAEEEPLERMTYLSEPVVYRTQSGLRLLP